MQPRLEDEICGDVPLFLTDREKLLEIAPDNIAMGRIKLHAWRINRLENIPSDLAGKIGYLIRLSYDFDLEPGVPAPDWAQVQFRFINAGAFVLDAIPDRVATPRDRKAYQLTEQLHFLPASETTTSPWPAGSAAATIVMPPVQPEITCSGNQGSLVGWKHSNGMPAGAHTGFVVLVASEHHEHVHVLVEGQYEPILDPELDLRLQAASVMDAFTVQLPRDEHGRPAIASKEATGRVFISYAPGSAEHEARVRALSEILASAGFKVQFDRCHMEVNPEWDKWIATQVLRSDFVVVVVSQSYLDATADPPADDRTGVAFDYRSLTGLLQRNHAVWMKKVLLIQLPDAATPPVQVPSNWMPGATTLTVESGEDGVTELLRRLSYGS